jgi:hypothetical protein
VSDPKGSLCLSINGLIMISMNSDECSSIYNRGCIPLSTKIYFHEICNSNSEERVFLHGNSLLSFHCLTLTFAPLLQNVELNTDAVSFVCQTKDTVSDRLKPSIGNLNIIFCGYYYMKG